MSHLDCHCHLSFLSVEEVEKILQESGPNKKWVMGGYQPSEWEYQTLLKNKFPDQILTCFGLHPWYIKSDEFVLSRDYEKLKMSLDQADFIGEVGLDFFGDDQILRKDVQRDLFEKQLELFQGKAFVFHIVQAHGEALNLLKDHDVKGFVHSFSGSVEVAEQYFDHGILLSFGPNILDPNFKKARMAIKELPLRALLIESDTPSHPLDEGDPAEVIEKVYQEAAQLREIPVDELKTQINQNFQKLIEK